MEGVNFLSDGLRSALMRPHVRDDRPYTDYGGVARIITTVSARLMC